MTLKLKPLHEQVVVITGASSGIGLATALSAARRGARLVVVARSASTLYQLAEQLTENGTDVLVVAADVGDRAQLQQVATLALQRFGRVDTWINNAGVSIYGRVDEVAQEDNERLFQTNFWGVVHGSFVALPHLRQHGGALINVGSEASEAAIPLQVMYTASKHAVKGFTDGLRLELEADGAPVSVTLIQPTAVDTPFPEHAGNYLAQAPKLPTPMIAPIRVSDAILEAATSPQRDVKVGAMASINTAMANLLPSLADAMARIQIGRQQRAEPALDRDGTLYRGGETGRVHGRGDERAENRARARDSNLR